MPGFSKSTSGPSLCHATLRSRRERVQGHLSAHARTKPMRADQSARCYFHTTKNIFMSGEVGIKTRRKLFK